MQKTLIASLALLGFAQSIEVQEPDEIRTPENY